MDWLSGLFQAAPAIIGATQGGSSAPSSGGGFNWPALLASIGATAARFRATPNAGASEAEIRKANRMNLLAGLFGTGLSTAGSLMQQGQQNQTYSALADILSGKATATGQAITPSEGAPGTVPTIAQPDQTASQRIFELARQNPQMSKDLFTLGLQQQQQEQELELKRAEILRKAQGSTFDDLLKGAQLGQYLDIPGPLRPEFAQGIANQRRATRMGALGLESAPTAPTQGPLAGLLGPVSPQPATTSVAEPTLIPGKEPTTIPQGLSESEAQTFKDLGVPETKIPSPLAAAAETPVAIETPTATPTPVPTARRSEQIRELRDRADTILANLQSNTEGLSPQELSIRGRDIGLLRQRREQLDAELRQQEVREEKSATVSRETKKEISTNVLARFQRARFDDSIKALNQATDNLTSGKRFSQTGGLVAIKRAQDNTGVIQGELSDLVSLIEPKIQTKLGDWFGWLGQQRPGFDPDNMTDVRRTVAVMAKSNYFGIKAVQDYERKLFEQAKREGAFLGEMPRSFETETSELARLYRENMRRVPPEERRGLTLDIEDMVKPPAMPTAIPNGTPMAAPSRAPISYRPGMTFGRVKILGTTE